MRKTLFSRRRSALDLFLLLPVLIVLSAGCLCSGGTGDVATCLASDGATLIWAGPRLLNIRLADGHVSSTEDVRAHRVLCVENNEVIAIRETSAYENHALRYERTARWQNAAKSYRLADIESFQRTLGLIQNRYFATASRGFVERSYSSGKSTVRYNVYNQPQIFSLEDSTDGQLKSHYLHRDKLGLPETRLYEDLAFYPLSLEENGALLFAMKIKGERAISFFKINMFDGRVTPTGRSFSMSEKMNSLEKVAADRAGRYVALVYEESVGKEYRKVIDVFDFETGAKTVSKTVEGISHMNKSPNLVFEENGAKLAILVEGIKLKEEGGVRNITVFDLESGRETAAIDVKKFFNQPEKAALIGLVGDDLLINYAPGEKALMNKENRLCKLSLTTRQIGWDIKLPDK